MTRELEKKVMHYEVNREPMGWMCARKAGYAPDAQGLWKDQRGDTLGMKDPLNEKTYAETIAASKAGYKEYIAWRAINPIKESNGTSKAKN